jgi:regulator of cell morphogenesis and NO signaling
VFEKLGIDYCCGGATPLNEACASAGVTEESVVTLLNCLQGLGFEDSGGKDWQTTPLSDLTKYIVNKHHTFVRTELVRLKELLAKVCSKHSTYHPELLKIRDILFRLQADLTDHMLKEERVLFPYIEKLETAVSGGEQAPRPAFGTVRNPVRMMMQEHEEAGQALRSLREVSSNYQVPGDGCSSYRTLYQALEEFEKDLHQHVHLENNILFPRAAELEAGA